MRIVIDASVALKWVIPEQDSGAAEALRGNDLIAPSLWLTEAANALWRYVSAGQLNAEQAARRFAELAGAPVAAITIEAHIAAALKIAVELRHPVYDCLYLAVALAHDTHVVTADRRFAAAAALPPLVGRVRLLGAP